MASSWNKLYTVALLLNRSVVVGVEVVNGRHDVSFVREPSTNVTANKFCAAGY